MLLDRKQLSWAVFTIIVALGATGIFIWDARHQQPSGSTVAGLTLGCGALAAMLFLVALAIKRRLPYVRLGKAQTWMRGHIWMGLLVVLLVALHGNFHLGGPVTTWLWLLLAVITVTGLGGLILQQCIPSLLLHGVQDETIYQQLPGQLEALVQLGENLSHEHESLARFFEEHARPFLEGSASATLQSPQRSESLFESLRTMMPASLHQSASDLEQLCKQRRQLLKQRFWMRLLTVWLLLHVPLSWVLLFLSIVHAVTAPRWG